MTQPILRVENVVKRFGGIIAVDHVSFDLHEGEIMGLIGPNGAGKTTLFNCITGVYKPEDGKIYYKNERIDGLPPHVIINKGIARTWQKTRPFKKITVLDTVAIGALLREKSVEKAREKAREILDIIGFDKNKYDKKGSEITLIDHKLVDLARALATEPKVLLLDEVAAGLRPQEMDRLGSILKKIHEELGISMIVVEHVMRFVMKLSERIVVMHEGAKIAEGTPNEVSNNEKVINAYLGSKEMIEL